MTYQKQLICIKNEVLDNLKNEARKLGANAVIGLTIDFDEISGKGKTMFMVTALGTAVCTERLNEKAAQDDAVVLSADLMRAELIKNEYLEKAAKNELKLDDNIWKFLIENRVAEPAKYILKRLDEMITSISDVSDALTSAKKNALEYFLSLEPDETKKIIYKAARMEKKFFFELAGNVINELDLFDPDEIISMLNSDELAIKKRAIALLKYPKQSYSISDIAKYQEIKEKIENSFGEVGKRYSKKQLLSSKENEYWECPCGGKNSMDAELCSKCCKDIYGFTNNDLRPEDGIRFAENRIKVLKKYFETNA